MVPRTCLKDARNLHEVDLFPNPLLKAIGNSPISNVQFSGNDRRQKDGSIRQTNVPSTEPKMLGRIGTTSSNCQVDRPDCPATECYHFPVNTKKGFSPK
jgi:hypothetical protein